MCVRTACILSMSMLGSPSPPDSELPPLLEDQIQGIFFFIFSACNAGQGQALNKHLWNKHTPGRKTIWSRVHLQSLLGKLLLKRGLESDCSSSKSGARVNRTHISIMTLMSAFYLLNPGKPARQQLRSSFCF